MEIEIKTSHSETDSLRDLSMRSRMFSFLRYVDMTRVEHDIKSEKYTFGSAYMETLGSGAEGKKNEDSYTVLPMGKGRTLFAVLDGASSQKKIEGLDDVGISGAFYISHMASMDFAGSLECQELCTRQELTAKDAMMAMNSWIHTRLKQVPGIDYSDACSVPGMAAAFLLVDISEKRLTLAQVADCAIAVVDQKKAVKIVTPNLNEKFDKETMDYARELSEKFNSNLSKFRSIPEAKELLRRQLIESFHRKTNKVGGCGIMNGMVEMISNNLIYTDSIPINDDLCSILMFSDGAILPYMEKDTSVGTAVRNFVGSLETSENESPLMRGASILESDSDFTKIPRMKLKDDATLISINFDVKSIYGEHLPKS